jgi:hypothetical protein
MIQKKSPKEVLEKLGKAEDLLLLAKKEFLEHIDKTLDGYNEGWVSKKLRNKLISTSQAKLKEVEASLAEIQDLKRRAMNLK